MSEEQMQADCAQRGCRLTVEPELMDAPSRRYTHEPLSSSARFSRLEIDLFDLMCDEVSVLQSVDTWRQMQHRASLANSVFSTFEDVMKMRGKVG